MEIRLAWLAAVVAVAIACGAEAADEWKTYRYPQDGFAAEYPTVPKPQEQKPDPAKMVCHSQYWSEKSDAAFGVIGAEHEKGGGARRGLGDLLQRLGAADMDADLGEALGLGFLLGDLRHPFAQAVAEHIGGRLDLGHGTAQYAQRRKRPRRNTHA